MHAFETPGSVSLQIKLPSGRVLVTTADEPRTTVEVVAVGRRGQDAIDEIEVTMEERLGRHVVKIEQKDRFRWGPIQITWGGDFECRICCPPGSDLDLAGGSTDLRAEGELGEVSVRTVSGDVTIGATAGELGISTTSGDVDAKAVSGGEVRVQTVSGDVRLGITRGTRTWIDAVSVSGRLESELGLEDQEPTSDEDGSPVVPLHVKTVSGDVSVVRAAAALST